MFTFGSRELCVRKDVKRGLELESDAMKKVGAWNEERRVNKDATHCMLDNQNIRGTAF